MQKEIWRIQDVMEGLSKHKEQRRSKESAGNCDPDLVPSEMNTNENPDYRLYKSEPELTTVAEVDETNPDDKSEAIVDLESGASKVSHYPVGVVSPRTKSPPLESTTIASYVTLRKGKKIETKSERPRSAVDHLCIADYPRTRMTVEEQLERMKKHQQACLREKKKGFSLFGASDLSPSLSPSFSRENSLKMLRRRDDKIFSNIKDIESCVRGETSQKRESPAEEILRLKEGAGTEVRESSAMESFAESDAKDVTTREAHDPTDPASSILTSGETSPQTSPSVTNHSTDSCTNNQEDVAVLLSYEFTTERLTRRTSLEDAPTEPHTMSNSPAQPQLSEGTHFMCV
ncbi:hypothetical protein GDO86_004912 [Hymenochirus boettgeri]|nr:hypothetical protein GDO86_004912 [Hymenochirus boettgeri]